jgi:hypothetical protein
MGRKLLMLRKRTWKLQCKNTFGDAAYNKNGLEKVRPYIKNTIESIITRKAYLIFSLTQLIVFGEE